MEETECIVCFSHYDEEDRRPRFMPCGHTMCSKCLERAIGENSKSCPKCRKTYIASNVEELPVNFSLQSLVKLLNVSTLIKSDKLPECADKFPDCSEHQLPVSSRCATHKVWICHYCLNENHNSELCKIIQICEELNINKSRQLDQSQKVLEMFEKKCKDAEECQKRIKIIIEETDQEIDHRESLIKTLQEEIEVKKKSKLEIEEKHSILDHLKSKRISYDQAVSTLKSCGTIIGVFKCSVEVQNEAEQLDIISQEMEKEIDLIQQSFKSSEEYFLGYPKLTERGGMAHLHSFKSTYVVEDETDDDEDTNNNDCCDDEYCIEDDDDEIDNEDVDMLDALFSYIEKYSPLTKNILTFLDISLPGQELQRIYIKLLNNTLRARQHLLLVTGQKGVSYKGLKFYETIERGHPGECLIIHPYDGKTADSLLDATTTDFNKHSQKAGQVGGSGWDNNLDTALFSIYLKDDPRNTDNTVFGQVTSGLEILQDAARSDDRDKIKVVDCGVVLC